MRFQHLTKSSSIGSNKIGVGVMYEGFGLDQRLHRANSDIVGTNEWELGALLEPPNPRWLHVHSFCWSGIKFKWSVLKLAPQKKKKCDGTSKNCNDTHSNKYNVGTYEAKISAVLDPQTHINHTKYHPVLCQSGYNWLRTSSKCGLWHVGIGQKINISGHMLSSF